MKISYDEVSNNFDVQLEQEAKNIVNFTRFLPTGFYRQLSEEVMSLDATFGMKLPKKEHEGRSMVFLNQTPRQFFALIDQLIEAHDISLDDIDLKNAEWHQLDEIYKLIVPVYKDLRKMGYTQYELCV